MSEVNLCSAIEQIFKHFTPEYEPLMSHDDDNNHISDAFDKTLNKYKEQGVILDYIVKWALLWDSCEYSTGYISVSWTTPNGKIHQTIRQWEEF